MKKGRILPSVPGEPRQTISSRNQVISPESYSLPRTGSHGYRAEWRPYDRYSLSVAVVAHHPDSHSFHRLGMGTQSRYIE